MQLTEKHIIKNGTPYYNVLDSEAYKSKNLYNATLYAVRQSFFENGGYLSYFEVQKRFQEQAQADYKALPSKVAQWTMKMVDINFRSFFNALKSYKENQSRFLGRPKIPKYLDSVKGRFILVYTRQAISKRFLDKDGLLKLTGNLAFAGFTAPKLLCFATCPMSLSPVFVKPTTEGVVLLPSGLGMTTVSEPSITATHEFVVPRSIPITFAILISS